ncbi:hypothetical protein [Oceanidesulfovibrio marinus]|uniref:hypothetical protein n=1 Tax=Oceanidesulfovibrio marinus TaxID=370038 RepID=UPI00129469C7|nr:hypothetical protein [Oceanidesulfovibrio marinus]
MRSSPTPTRHSLRSLVISTVALEGKCREMMKKHFRTSGTHHARPSKSVYELL